MCSLVAATRKEHCWAETSLHSDAKSFIVRNLAHRPGNVALGDQLALGKACGSVRLIPACLLHKSGWSAALG